MSKLLICMVGLPRSGKTTIVNKLMAEHSAPVVRRDDIRLALHGKRYEKLAEPFVKAISDVMIRSLFLSGHEVVICDETNYSRAARDYHKTERWKTVFYEVNTDPDTCKQRALATGQADLVGVIDEMWARREPLGADEERYDNLTPVIEDRVDKYLKRPSRVKKALTSLIEAIDGQEYDAET